MRGERKRKCECLSGRAGIVDGSVVDWSVVDSSDGKQWCGYDVKYL